MTYEYSLLGGVQSTSRTWRFAPITFATSMIVILLITPSLIGIHLPSLISSAPLTTSILRANESLDNITIASPSGQYRLLLQESGSLELLDQTNSRTLFSTDTSLYFDASWRAVLRTDGVLELSWHHPASEPTHGIIWQSNLLSGCRESQHPQRVNQSDPPFLELLDNGQLHIRTAQDHICTISKPAIDKGKYLTLAK